MDAGFYDLAIADLEKSARIAPDEGYPHQYLALAYHKLGREEDALKAANASVTDDDRDPWGYRYRAEIYESLGQREAAIADYRKIIELNFGDENRDIAREALHRLGAS